MRFPIAYRSEQAPIDVKLFRRHGQNVRLKAEPITNMSQIGAGTHAIELVNVAIVMFLPGNQAAICGSVPG